MRSTARQPVAGKVTHETAGVEPRRRSVNVLFATAAPPGPESQSPEGLPMIRNRRIRRLAALALIVLGGLLLLLAR